ncbi:MAG: hypothetical protein RSE93_01695 [Oscillospiraceae bacterium]
MNCIKWRFISWIIGAIGIVPFLVGFYSDHFWKNPFSYIGIILLGISVIVGVCKFRCPSCGRHISDRSPIDISNCPYCGKNLE